MRVYNDFIKRLIDVLISGSALIVLSIPLSIITIWLHYANKGAGAFFFQERPGRFGKIFHVCKYKTMTDERDEDGNLLPDSQRITRVGRFIRSTSIDELPQLWNVLKGDMSLIGPRPLLVKYLPWYTADESKRHNVRPGITGWAQVNGRNHCTWEKRFELDTMYAENVSFMFDFKILLTTVKNVLKRSDIEVVPNLIDFDDYRKAVLENCKMNISEYSQLSKEEQLKYSLPNLMNNH